MAGSSERGLQPTIAVHYIRFFFWLAADRLKRSLKVDRKKIGAPPLHTHTRNGHECDAPDSGRCTAKTKNNASQALRRAAVVEQDFFHFRAAGNLVVATLRRCVLQALHFNGLNNESLCTWLGVVDASTETIMAISETELTGKDLMEMVHRSRSPSMP